MPVFTLLEQQTAEELLCRAVTFMRYFMSKMLGK
jgi:hypothetical protein